MTSTVQKLPASLLVLALLGGVVLILARQQLHEFERPHVAWDKDSLYLYSAKDGPLFITHLVKLQAGTNEYAVAQLPVPVTVIDSRGQLFSTGLMHSLTWVTLSGATTAPPVVGHPMKAFYFVPEQTKPTK